MTLKFTSVPSKTLAENITTSSTTFQLTNILGWDNEALAASDFGTQAFGSIRSQDNSRIEFFEWDPATIADGEIDFVRRGLQFDGNLLTEVTENKLEWIKTDAIVNLGADVPQMLQWMKEYADALSQAGGTDASTTVKGFTESATSAEIDADEDVGATGAVLSIAPDQLAASKYGIFLAAVTGMVFPYAGSSVPSGFLSCDGSAVSRTTYSSLFTVIGTTFGTGDGSTTFNVPDLRGAFPLGVGTRTETFDFTSASVNATSNEITVTSNSWLYTGAAVALTNSGGSLPGGLSATTYYVIRVSASVIKLATSRENANLGTAVDITSGGSGTHTLTLSFTARSLAAEGGEEQHQLLGTEVGDHRHGPPAGSTEYQTEDGSGSGAAGGGSGDGSSVYTGYVDGTQDQPHNNMPPFVALNYIIKT